MNNTNNDGFGKHAHRIQKNPQNSRNNFAEGERDEGKVAAAVWGGEEREEKESRNSKCWIRIVSRAERLEKLKI